MNRYTKYQRKIKKYQKKLKKQKSKVKNKLIDFKDFIYKIGISSTEEFTLKNSSKPILFPGHLGLIFVGEFTNNLFPRIKRNLETIYPLFFFSISNLGLYDFSSEIFLKGIKNELKDNEKPKEILKLHPTNKFHQLIIDKKKEFSLDMIVAITDLPLYSSSNNSIIFLVGEAHIPHQSCIVSTLKLMETFYDRQNNDTLFQIRLNKEIIHEVGHLILGSDHCENPSCVMSYSDTIREIDEKSLYLCKNCQRELKTIKERFNF
ncbi:MAG: hypothetical protein EU543_04520 [Promethearchaeota archaeon]|nr:MAG: hypothetical protein EU543_04520 [Candidatus Lokiarchaeota archaeon]